MLLAQRVMTFFCKPPEEVGYLDPADVAALARREVPQDPLKDLRREFPDLANLLREREVLDFGCGLGDQAAAIAREFSARVVGYDKHTGLIAAAARRYGQLAQFTDRLDGRRFDVVISQDAMEHFDDPESALAAMAAALRPGGVVLMMFGPPWWAPYGAHMRFFCAIPWLQLWFSEKTVMAVRARYRHDGARRYEEVESGLNRMSLAKFERLLRNSELKIRERHYIGVKRIQFLTRLPLIRELMTVLVAVTLTKR